MIHILVPMELFKGDRKIPIYGAWETYIQKLINHNLVPLFISPFIKSAEIDDVYHLSDGVFFMGGSDVNPKYYTKKKHNKTSVTEHARDKLELAILGKAIKDKKPFFGICRGCQMLAVASGGTLVQHVPDMVGNKHHSLRKGQPYDALATRDKHPILIEKTSRVYRLLRKEKILVNSGHHQAAATVGKDFRISGRSDDGIAEIIEHTDQNYFCFAVQPHPEAEKHGELEPFFDAFAKAAKEYHATRK